MGRDAPRKLVGKGIIFLFISNIFSILNILSKNDFWRNMKSSSGHRNWKILTDRKKKKELCNFITFILNLRNKNKYQWKTSVAVILLFNVFTTNAYKRQAVMKHTKMYYFFPELVSQKGGLQLILCTGCMLF